MKNICAKWSVMFGFAFLASASAACLDVEVDGDAAQPVAPEVVGEPAAGEAHRPFYVASFDHVPTEEEIQADMDRFMAEERGREAARAWHDPVDTVPLPLPAGYKVVRIDATTSNIESAGTEHADDVSFYGLWERNGVLVSDYFTLNYTTKDDLNRNTTDIYYYVVNVGVGGSDRFVFGHIYNNSTDGWHCNRILLRDITRTNLVRLQTLPFNQWIDTPDLSPSTDRFATNTSLLSY